LALEWLVHKIYRIGRRTIYSEAADLAANCAALSGVTSLVGQMQALFYLRKMVRLLLRSLG